MTDKKKQDDEAAVLERIARMGQFEDMGMRLHQVIMASAPDLKPRTWYGMPGYAKTKTSPVICFFRADDYMTFGLTEKANLTLSDDATDQLIESAWFLATLDEATESRIADIVRKAVS